MKIKLFEGRAVSGADSGRLIHKDRTGRLFSGTRRLKAWQACTFAIVVTGVTLGIRLVLDAPLGGRPTLVIFTVPVMLSAYVDGMRAGLVATGLSHCAASYCLLPPLYSFAVTSSAERWQLFFVTLAGVFICVLNEELRRARRRAMLATHDFEDAEEERRRIFTLSPEMLCIFGFDGFFKDLNPAWANTLGYRKEELLSTPFIEFIHPDDRPTARVEAEGAGDGNSLIAFENRYRCKDGSYRRFHWSVTPVTADRVMYGVARDITGSEAAGVDLAASMKEVIDFKTALDEHAIVAVTDPQGKITFVNDRFCAISKYSRGELIGQDHRLVNSGHHSREFMRELWSTISRGKVWQGEIKNRAKDGSYYWLATTIVPFLNERGKPRQYVAFRTDITAHKNAEEAVRASREMLHLTLDAAHIGHWSLDLVTQAASRSVQHDQVFGYDELLPEWTYSIFLAHVHPEDREYVDRLFLAGVAAKTEWDIECRIIRRDGAERWIWAHGNVFKNAAGEAVQMLGMVSDITARKRAEQVIRESEERFRFLDNLAEATRTLVDPAQIMAVMARMLGAHLSASRCAYADVEKGGEVFTILHDYTDGCASTVGKYQLSSFGARAVAKLHSGKTLIIRNVGEELLPDQGADMFSSIGIRAIITCPLVKKGELRALMAVHQATPRDWKPGEIAIVQDVVERCWATIERRTAEDKIHELNSELEERVNERTSQLEASNRELEAFSYSVSHDLRAPVRGIDGYVRMLQEDCADRLDAEGNRLLDVVSSEAKRMGRLIDDLLAFSRLGREQMSCTDVDMTALARSVFDHPTRADPQSAPQFNLKPLPVSQGDLGMLRQVFVNLIGNAVKFTRNQPNPVVEVGGSRGDGEVSYYVRDNGVGFDAKYGHKLFGVFQRLHSEEEFEGTGVGLALVQRVIHRHGGRVWAEGKPNEGATFHFTLPIRAQSADEQSY